MGIKQRAWTVAIALIAALVPWAVQPSVVQAGSSTSQFVSVAPCRLVDTRTNTGFVRFTPHVIRVTAAGRCGIGADPAALALSVVMVDAGFPGFLTLYPSGTSRPTASMLNFQKGQTRSNAAIVRVGPNGTFDVYQATSGDIVIDTAGWFEPVDVATAGRLVPLSPRRLLDTRESAPVPPGGSVVVPLPPGVASDAAALSLNITVTEASGPGFVTTYPTGGTRPLASVLNLDAAGQTRASGGIHTVGPAGLTVYLSGGGHVVVDITGWFTGPSAAASTDGLFTPADPVRLLDTRYLSPLGLFTRIAADGTVAIPTPGGNAATLALNLTSVDGVPGYVTAYPVGSERPVASNVNPVGGGDVVANFGIVPASAAGVEFYALQPTHLIVDFAGTFSAAVASSPPPPTSPTSPTSSPTTSTTTTTSTTQPPTTTSTTTTTTTTTTTSTTTTTTTAPPTTVPSGSRGIVYLTFDDGPQPSATGQIMSLLEQYGIRGTFFVEGRNVAALPGVASAITNRGHAIGNHTYNHPDLRTLTDAQIRQELESTQTAIAAATGRRPGCMRPPYGYVDPASGPAVSPMNTNVRSIINATGLSITMWTHDTVDWDTSSTSTQEIVNVLNRLPRDAGAVSTVLMHDYAPNTYTALQQWLPANASRYDFRVVPTC